MLDAIMVLFLGGAFVEYAPKLVGRIISNRYIKIIILVILWIILGYAVVVLGMMVTLTMSGAGRWFWYFVSGSILSLFLAPIIRKLTKRKLVR